MSGLIIYSNGKIYNWIIRKMLAVIGGYKSFIFIFTRLTMYYKYKTIFWFCFIKKYVRKITINENHKQILQRKKDVLIPFRKSLHQIKNCTYTNEFWFKPTILSKSRNFEKKTKNSLLKYEILIHYYCIKVLVKIIFLNHWVLFGDWPLTPTWCFNTLH